jgi:hypothetical protein
VFDQIFREMRNIHSRLNDLERTLSGWNPKPLELSGFELFSLPDHLRETYMVVASKGECEAMIVSNQTGKSRAIESNYLNQLSRMGWLNKRRISRTIHFRPASEKMPKKAILAGMKGPKAKWAPH